MGSGRAGRWESGQNLSYTEIGRNIGGRSRVYTRAGVDGERPAQPKVAPAGNRLKVAPKGGGRRAEPLKRAEPFGRAEADQEPGIAPGNETQVRRKAKAEIEANIEWKPLPLDNEAATLPHPRGKRPDKGKLTQAKKIVASGLTEAEAIERAKSGDAESFEGLYGLHKRRVYSLCLRMTGNTAEAEDLTQEAFLQLYRKIATFRGESAFSTWLHRLAVNVVLMHLRKKGLPEISLDEALEPQHEDGPKKDIGARDNVLAGSIDRVNLERAIESLPPGYRIIFVLHDVEGYEHNEIAEMMGCSIGNSKSQLHKARMKLRDLLKLSRAEKAARR
jgi:RNA polymerase sigma-70 factor (ECF subfamily)